ncbi:uncharacterized protein LOC125273390 isoform X3 [Megalobrama amblycephala]|uniref:uncharacterized protein LOC125273390 isoform X3 n=1 Tax=Megalobrama amblycephala TaxID=75352 RepID=UPI0020142095|nr:uncharacterized protein LOC125273390 isoform X3 [Megalobrama amblycephala]
MEGESITDTESETESEWDPESSTEYDSLSENDREKKGKRGGKRKRKYSSQNLRQTIENQLELPVKCGAKDGVLYVEKYNDMQACIFSEGQWFKPIDFERFGGKARSKKWRNSIVYNDIPLQELIRDGLLLPFKKYGVQNKQNDSPESSPVTDRLRKRKYVAQIGSPESSSVTVRLRKRKCRRQPFHSEPKESINGSEDGDGDSDNNDVNEVLDLDDDDDDDVIDLSMFEGPTLPVTCGSESGILHKYRFAKGHRGRCIRTENFWLTPENFIKLNKPEGTWRKDIVTNEIPLGKLIMKRVLEPHMINCYCEICEEQDQYQQNDDVCFVCNSEGDLVCCDECPRAFHSHCHLPAADGDSLGQWSCTFCVMKNMKDSSQKTQQEVLSSPVSQYTLHCQYLLLHLLHESMTEPCTNVSGYSKNICSPMMLGRVKLNLENNDYQTVQEFVSDIEQIFNYCCTSNGDNDSSRMTSRLKEAFKKEFETVFKEKRNRICAPNKEMTDLSVFQAPSLPVTCVSLTGTLHKYRFATGSRGKCIRTEESWFTPEEFVNQEQTLTDGHWKKDILCHGKTLNFLLKKKILRIHPLLCECVKCSHQLEDLMAQTNDDVCYVCESGGDLVCCDECPRAFHSHCHLPAVDGDSPGEWICTFCMLKTSHQWRDSSSMTEQEAFNAPVSQYRLHCHYLLLCVYKEDTQRVFVEDPRKTVSRYSQFISQPMWLDRIKLKLESDEYQTVGAFVSDFRLIFSNCSTFNKDNKFGKMRARLKEMFEKEFQKIFTIQ